VSAVDDPATLKMMVPLVEPRIEGAKLIFKMVDDPEHPDTWEMVATGPDSATLQLIETWNSDLQEIQTREQIAKWQKPFRLKQAWKGNAL